jgi:hypothetical protein
MQSSEVAVVAAACGVRSGLGCLWHVCELCCADGRGVRVHSYSSRPW